MSLKLNDVNGDASEWAYGFKATSRSLKPVHVAQVVFSHTLGQTSDPELLFEFTEKPGKKPSEELPEEVLDKFDIDSRDKEERLDEIRYTLRKVLANDNALYANTRGSAPTATSDWFVTDPTAGVNVGRFVHYLISESNSDLESNLQTQLTDHHDTVSVLFRPLQRMPKQSSASV
ncbi:hypothetical protein [Halobaculum litoreum]|uniref:hypothetical protein n=1 Tax=Halobaculum litoreum TaxID=3031998 RepID=UPI0024C328A5|nr:hypothetical protein [Halobaculum sp. DT92]